MKIIRNIYNIKEINSGSVVSIGNFDGIHLGHQKILNHTYKIGKQHQLITVIILFEPQPLEFLRKKNFPNRITIFREKIKYIFLYKINFVLCIKFNYYFSSLSPEDFIINILINKLHIKYIVIGDDFRFGFNRNGTIKLLNKLSKKYKFSIFQVKPVYKNSFKVSSTKIRQALKSNNMKLTASLLGRFFSISGRVIHGSKVARTLGYPTANILLHKNSALNTGVYAVKIRCLFDTIFTGIANVHIRLNTNTSKIHKILEVYLFNIKIDLYGKHIEIIFYKKIREIMNFVNIKDLKIQISTDIQLIKKYFNKS